MKIHGDPRRNYGKEWRRWRKKHKLSQETVALITGIARSCLSNIETGKVRPISMTRRKMEALQKRYKEA